MLETKSYVTASPPGYVLRTCPLCLQIRDTYIKVASEILQLVGFGKKQAEKRINDIVQFETELAIVSCKRSSTRRIRISRIVISVPMETLQKPNETYFLMTLKELQQQYDPIELNISSLLNNMLNLNSSNPIKLDANDQVIVLSLELMSKVSTILKDYLLKPNKSHIVIDHLLFSLVFDLSSHLTNAFEKTTLPFLKELYGMESLPERWEYCVKETDATFGFGLGKRSPSACTRMPVLTLCCTQVRCTRKRCSARRIASKRTSSSPISVRCSRRTSIRFNGLTARRRRKRRRS